MWEGGGVCSANAILIGSSKCPPHHSTSGSEGHVWKETLLTQGVVIWICCLHTPVGCLENFAIVEWFKAARATITCGKGNRKDEIKVNGQLRPPHFCQYIVQQLKAGRLPKKQRQHSHYCHQSGAIGKQMRWLTVAVVQTQM